MKKGGWLRGLKSLSIVKGAIVVHQTDPWFSVTLIVLIFEWFLITNRWICLLKVIWVLHYFRLRLLPLQDIIFRSRLNWRIIIINWRLYRLSSSFYRKRQIISRFEIFVREMRLLQFSVERSDLLVPKILEFKLTYVISSVFLSPLGV